jgi:hypothetical protein
MNVDPKKVFTAIAKSLVEFGYHDCTAEMVSDVYEAMKDGKKDYPDLPHGVVGAFAKSQINDAIDMEILAPVNDDDN